MRGERHGRGFERLGRLRADELGLPVGRSRQLLLSHAWRQVAGEALAQRAPASRVRRGILEIHVGDRRWAAPLTELIPRLRIAEAGLGTREELISAFADAAAIRDLDPEARDLEGYLFPDTYSFPRGEDPGRIAEAMVRRFREIIGEDYVTQAGKAGLGLREAVTLASLIEKETSVPHERDRISGVFHNRLRRGMRLECDPTVIYALRRSGRTVSRLTYGDLRFDSPWNTYVAEGLPPGPIANPGRESLWASVRPGEGDELYFVASPDGGHRFSKNLSEHLEAVAEWRRYVRSSR